MRVHQAIIKFNGETRAKSFSSAKFGVNNHIGTRNNPKPGGTRMAKNSTAMILIDTYSAVNF